MSQNAKKKVRNSRNKKYIKTIALVDKLLLKNCETPSQNMNEELKSLAEIYELVGSIRKLEKDMDKVTVVNRFDSEVQERFVSWLKENGANLNGVQIAQFSGYDLGLKADDDIKIGDLLCSIPRELMLSHDKAKNSLFWELAVRDKILAEMSNVCMAMYLLYEKFRPDSFWKPYIDMLPSSYNTIHYFTIDEFKALLGSNALKPAITQYKSLGRQYSYFFRLIYTADHPVCEVLKKYFTFDEYR